MQDVEEEMKNMHTRRQWDKVLKMVTRRMEMNCEGGQTPSNEKKVSKTGGFQRYQALKMNI